MKGRGVVKNASRPTLRFSKESISPDVEFNGESFGHQFKTF